MLYEEGKLLLIAGPCALESEQVVRKVADVLKKFQEKNAREVKVIFKGSFDKANRTSLMTPRGPGMAEGLQLLAMVKDDYDLPTLTDIHERFQVEPVSAVVDVLQIPAFLCRQTDLIVEAAKTGCVVNVKKGQFLSPMEALSIIEKLEASHSVEHWLTERGTTFGYNNLIVDMRVFPILQKAECPIIFDATHAVQLPGGMGKQSGGERQFILPLARAALAAGAHGLFIETHPEPENAVSDAATQLPLQDFESTLEECLKIWRVR